MNCQHKDLLQGFVNKKHIRKHDDATSETEREAFFHTRQTMFLHSVKIRVLFFPSCFNI